MSSVSFALLPRLLAIWVSVQHLRLKTVFQTVACLPMDTGHLDKARPSEWYDDLLCDPLT